MLRCALVLFVLSSVCAQQAVEAGEGDEPGVIAGRVVDRDGKPIAGVAVFVCDGRSGVPIGEASGRVFTESFGEKGSGKLSLLRAVTDESGQFHFAAVHGGTYRLVAQSWRGVDEPKDLFEVSGPVVELRGLAEQVVVTAGETARVTMQPVGSASLQVAVDVANDWVVCAVSTWPPRADPILGFVGWGGKFLRNAVGCNRMPRGKTTFTGLPAGKLWFTLFANDNNPGFGAGTAEVRNDVVTEARATLVADWSNARHEPPKELAPLVRRLAEDRSLLPGLFARHRIAISRSAGPWTYWRELIEQIDTKLELPGGESVRVVDLCAANLYLELGESVAKRRGKRK